MPKPHEEFVHLVNEIMHQRDCTYDEAWSLARSMHASTYQAMMNQPGRQYGRMAANSRGGRTTQAQREASKEFTDAVNEKVREQHLDWETAWQRVKALRRDLYEAMNSVSVVNEAGQGGSSLVAGPQVCASLLLPAGSSQEEFSTAFEANGRSLTPINLKAMFAALVGLHERKLSIPHGQAITFCTRQYPVLAQTLLAE